MEQNTPHLCLYCNESIFRLLCHSNDRIELCLFGYDRNGGRSRVSIFIQIKFVIAERKTVCIILLSILIWNNLLLYVLFLLRWIRSGEFVSIVQFTSKILCLNRFGTHIHTKSQTGKSIGMFLWLAKCQNTMWIEYMNFHIDMTSY